MNKVSHFSLLRLGAIAGLLVLTNQKNINLFGKKSNNQQNKQQNTETYIWGNGYYQAKPDASLQYKNFEPKLINTFLGSDKQNLIKVFFGELFEGGIDTQGSIYVWKKPKLSAAKEVGPEGENDNIRQNIIKLGGNESFIQIQFTKGFVWGLNTKGEVFQWPIDKKFNDERELIDFQVLPDKQRKIQTLPPNISQIATGEDHFVALTKEGEVYTMGDDTYGQCGLGSFKRSTAPPFYDQRVKNPQKIKDMSRIIKIVTGHNHTLALSQDGQLYGWGSNSCMQLSHEKEFSRVDSPLISIYTPVRLSDKFENNIVTDMAAGEEFSVLVTKNKLNNETEIYSCGYNIHGELGLGFLRHVSDLQKIEALSNYKIKTEEGEKDIQIKQIECGSNHCICLLNVGAIMEWGANEYGQLGNKKRVFSENPLVISSFNKKNIISVSSGWTSSAVISEAQQEKTNKDKK